MHFIFLSKDNLNVFVPEKIKKNCAQLLLLDTLNPACIVFFLIILFLFFFHSKANDATIGVVEDLFIFQTQAKA
jgi:cadmium resistance protein CadD (predicted permease)